MIIKKTILIVATVITGLFVSSLHPVFASANAVIADDAVSMFSTDADFKNHDIKKILTTDGARFEFYSKETGELTKSISYSDIYPSSSECESLVSSVTPMGDPGDDDTIFLRQYDINNYSGDIVTTLRIVVQMYRSGSFSSFNAINDVSMYVSSSGYASLENVYATAFSDNADSSFPTAKIEYYGTGVITIDADLTWNGGLSINIPINDLLEWGFSYTVDASSTYHFRKAVTISGHLYSYPLG